MSRWYALGPLGVIVCLFWTGCARSTLQLSSTIVDEYTKRPVNGAAVKLIDESEGALVVVDSTSTQQDGRFFFKSKLSPTKKYKVVANKALLADDVSEPVQFAKRPPISDQISLRLGAGLEGKVVSVKSGRSDSVAVPGAKVVLWESDDPLDEQLTSREGHFSFATLDSSVSYRLTILKFNHLKAQADLPGLKHGMIWSVTCPIQYVGDDYTPRQEDDKYTPIIIIPEERGLYH